MLSCVHVTRCTRTDVSSLINHSRLAPPPVVSHIVLPLSRLNRSDACPLCQVLRSEEEGGVKPIPAETNELKKDVMWQLKKKTYVHPLISTVYSKYHPYRLSWAPRERCLDHLHRSHHASSLRITLCCGRYPFKTPRAQKGPAKGPPEPMDLTPLPEVEKKLIDFSNKVQTHDISPSVLPHHAGTTATALSSYLPACSSPSPFSHNNEDPLYQSRFPSPSSSSPPLGFRCTWRP